MPYDPIAYKAQYERDNYDKILLRVPKGMREEIAERAAERGMSTNQYILSLIERDKEDKNV